VKTARNQTLSDDLLHGLLWSIALAFLIWCLAIYAAMASHMFVETNMNDFGRFYYSARAFLDDGDMYGPSPATTASIGSPQQLWNMNPPHFHLLILPLARLSPLYALLLWSISGAVALAVSLRVVARELALRWTPSGAAWTIWASIVFSATGAVVVTGQVAFLLLLPVTLAWVDARRGRWHRAAVWLGVVASIKPFLWFFWVYLLLKRQTKPAVTMVLVAVLCVVAGLVVFGADSYTAWLNVLSRVDWDWLPMNGSITGLLSRSLSDGPFYTPLLHAPTAVTSIAAVSGLVVGVATLVAVARDRSPEAVDRSFAGVLLASLLISPLGWVYYLWLVAGPAAALWQTIGQRRSPRRNICIALAVPGLVCPLILTAAWREYSWGAVTLGSIYTWATLALWAAVMFDWRVRRRD